MTDYQKTVLVRASPDVLFSALTTVSGLSSWWTDVSSSGDELTFSFDSPLVMRVDQALPVRVQWTAIACAFLPDWVGTRPTFGITPISDGLTELRFCHYGLNSELDCIEICSRGWDHVMESLRLFVEVGLGMPRGSAGDLARRR